jgi:hypothetical protein
VLRNRYAHVKNCRKPCQFRAIEEALVEAISLSGRSRRSESQSSNTTSQQNPPLSLISLCCLRRAILDLTVSSEGCFQLAKPVS